jgi:anti-sigma factor RsiW
MNHPGEDVLVLYAYGELPPLEAGALEAHLAACDACQARFAQLERARVAAEWAVAPSATRLGRWAALAAAAGVAALVLTGRHATPPADREWSPAARVSTTAAYVAGGPAVVTIDSLLARLEQENAYARP